MADDARGASGAPISPDEGPGCFLIAVKTRLQAAAARRAATSRRQLAERLVRLMDDAGVTQRALATASGVSQPHISRVLAGEVNASHEVYARLGAVLGADFAARFYPTTGPVIRDRHQARMLELLLGRLHPRWRPLIEVAVRRPSRGWIDAVLHEPREQVIVASELQSELRRLEQLVRWQVAKAESLPSWDGWTHLGGDPSISRLLVVRRTRGTRAGATEFAHQLRSAYPAHPDDALAALVGTEPWPGAALVWAVLDGGEPRFAGGR